MRMSGRDTPTKPRDTSRAQRLERGNPIFGCLDQAANLTSIRFLNSQARLPFQFTPIFRVNPKDLAPPPSLLVCRLGVLSALRPANIPQAFRSTSQYPLTPRIVE